LFKDHIDQVKKIKRFLEREAPRNAEGTILEPYRGWIKQMESQLEAARKWLASGDPGGEAPKMDPAERDPITEDVKDLRREL